MPTTIDIREFPERIEEALRQAEAGEEVVLVDGPTPRARLVPVADVGPPPDAPSGDPPRRILGLHPGAFEMADDFDDPLPDAFWLGES